MEKEMRLQAALQLQKAGYDIVLLRENTKRAAFEGWNVRGPPTRFELQAHMRRRLFNVAIRLKDSGVIVADLDNHSLEWGRERGIDSPMIARTARGFHVYMRGILEKSSTFEGGDIKATGHITAPPSVVNEWRYEWVNGIVSPKELPLFPPDLLPRKPKPMPVVPLEVPTDAKIEGMRKWIRKVEAIEGSGGDRQTFRVALKICSVIRDSEKALAEIMAWNCEGYAQPPWTERELRHKISSAMKYINK